MLNFVWSGENLSAQVTLNDAVIVLRSMPHPNLFLLALQRYR